MHESFDLRDQVVVITGGGGVLCGHMAQILAQQGAQVAIVDLNTKAAEQLAEKLRSDGHAAIGVGASVLEKQSLENAHEQIRDELGKIDILINGAGGNKLEATTSEQLRFFDIPSEAIRFVFDLNCLGTILATQVFAKDMVEKDKGVILNISSMNALRPLTRIPAYSAAKAAVSNFTQWLAVHMCHHYSKHIRVNAIAPGFFLTEQNRFLLTDSKSGELTQRGQCITDHTPMGRFGLPEDLDGTMLWLLSDAARFVTGIIVPVDGGFSAYSGV